MQEPDQDSLKAFGAYVRAQRKLAQVSQRNLAKAAGFSDSYLSQLERGQYMPSAPTIRALADAFGVSPSVLFAQLGMLDDTDTGEVSVEAAIYSDQHLTLSQRDALVQVYRSYLAANAATTAS